MADLVNIRDFYRESDFLPHLKRVLGARLETKGRNIHEVTTTTSHEMFIERAPEFHETHWCSWWAFRTLPPKLLERFDRRMAELFEDFKKGSRSWVTYNADKRKVLYDLLSKIKTPS